MSSMSDEACVLAAADHVVRCFRQTDTDAYFQCFSQDAVFVFHSVPTRLEGRDAYRALWQDWLNDGFRVLQCDSTAGHVLFVSSDVAVFTHEVGTRLVVGGVEESLRERETIVFARRPDGWLAVHEHLSAM